MIQQSINQGLSIASALYTQTGHYREKIAKRERAIENKEMIRKITNEEKLDKKITKESFKILSENAGNVTANQLKNEMQSWTESEDNILKLKREKAILTGETKDINAYNKFRRQTMASRENNQGIVNSLKARERSLKAQESLQRAQEEKRQKFYLGGEEIPENSPLYAKAMEAYKKQQGGNK